MAIAVGNDFYVQVDLTKSDIFNVLFYLGIITVIIFANIISN